MFNQDYLPSFFHKKGKYSRVSSFLVYLVNSLPDGNVYQVQWDSYEFLQLPENTPLKFDPATGVYDYDGSDETIYTRTITIDTVASLAAKRVTVTVSWEEQQSTQQIFGEVFLYDWF